MKTADTLDYYYMVPQNVEDFARFADLHERQSGAPTPLGETGVVLTEKMGSYPGGRGR